MSIIIPEGMTVNIGRREYHGGEALPANAPESVKKRCADYTAKLTKKGNEPEKPAPGNAGDKNSEGGKP
ncbi:MAG: hypothetical protein LBH43_18005 [Treponema sp.]|jgi:hypothetical protein|nr:hypothetical protein [Treponema sp.]